MGTPVVAADGYEIGLLGRIVFDGQGGDSGHTTALEGMYHKVNTHHS
jgi:hypothetical protein